MHGKVFKYDYHDGHNVYVRRPPSLMHNAKFASCAIDEGPSLRRLEACLCCYKATNSIS